MVIYIFFKCYESKSFLFPTATDNVEYKTDLGVTILNTIYVQFPNINFNFRSLWQYRVTLLWSGFRYSEVKKIREITDGQQKIWDTAQQLLFRLNSGWSSNKWWRLYRTGIFFSFYLQIPQKNKPQIGVQRLLFKNCHLLLILRATFKNYFDRNYSRTG